MSEIDVMDLSKKIEVDNEDIFNTCTHEIVIKYHNHYPRISKIDGNYYCPMCRKSIGTHSLEFFNSCDFKDSRIIELNNIELDANCEVLARIRKEVMKNFELFYDSSATNEELASRLEESLRNISHGYVPVKKL